MSMKLISPKSCLYAKGLSYEISIRKALKRQGETPVAYRTRICIEQFDAFNHHFKV